MGKKATVYLLHQVTQGVLSVAENPLFQKYGSTIRNGTVIFQGNDVGNRMYIIQSGSVKISKFMDGHVHTLAELGKGEFFGEMAIVSSTARSATATAVGTVELLEFDRQGFEAMIEKNVKIAMSVIDKLCRRLDHANGQIRDLVRINQRNLVALKLYDRFMDAGSEEKALTLSTVVDAIDRELDAPADWVREVIDGFVSAGICAIDGNALRLKNKAKLVAVAEG